jgi:hypothetical protein
MELAESSNKDFRRVDVWMLGASLKRLIESIEYVWIAESDYC